MKPYKKHLYLCTVNYPFSQGEHLLEFELGYLAKRFDKITLISTDITTPQTFIPPVETEITRFDLGLSTLEKILSVKCLLRKVVINEIGNLKKLGIKPSIKIVLTITQAFAKAKKSSKLITLLLRKNGPDFHSYFYSWWTNEMTLSFALLKNGNEKIKAITRARAVDLYFERHKPAYLPFRYLIYENLDLIFCISDEGKDYILKKFRLKDLDRKIKIGRMGAINRYTRASGQIGQKLVIVSCSNIIRLKRIHLIIEALELINNIDIHWKHFGEGDLRQEVEETAKRSLETKPNISYSFEGFIRNKDLMGFYFNNPVDLFINVSEYEGVPVSIMEAFSFSIPAIATNVGGVSEMVNSENGYLLPVETTAREIAEKVNFFWNLSPNEKKGLKNNAFKTWNDYYNADRNFEMLAEQISEL
jgi:glycosyltransferase involved in cell wall biosynthesis